MGTRADFYIDRNNKIEWIGSLYKDGHPWNIPTDILIQINPVMFEELTIDFLESQNSSIRKNGDAWPWPWEDSLMTDYSYIFKMNKVFAYSPEIKCLFDPLQIVQGEDLEWASFQYSFVHFPTMLKRAVISTEELLNQYGYQFTEVI